MQRETMEIKAVWKDRPSWFASGTMQWVAVSTGAAESKTIRESPAFPLENQFVASNDSDDDNSFIRVDCTGMDDVQCKVIETMLADFASSLERDGWVQTGQGDDWFNRQFERAIST